MRIVIDSEQLGRKAEWTTDVHLFSANSESAAKDSELRLIVRSFINDAYLAKSMS